jgi:YesN/AraC family two-component response regulator
MKLLIIDDEENIRKGLASLNWVSIGIQHVLVTENGLNAIGIICREYPDIILADICMPGIDGIQLAKLIKEKKILSKVVLLSGYGSFDYAQAAIKAGVYDYLLKPSTPKEILDCVKRAISDLNRGSLLDIIQKQNQIIPDTLLGAEGVIKDQSNLLNKIFAYIQNNYMKDITLGDLSTSIHFNVFYISRYIKKATGYTFLELVTFTRMMKAAELIKTTDLKIYEICNNVGIEDQRYFSQIFKKNYGVTPNEFRKKLDDGNYKKNLFDLLQ